MSGRAAMKRFFWSGLEQLVNHRLTTHARQNRHFQYLEEMQFGQELIILLEGFTEAKSRVDNYIMESKLTQLMNFSDQEIQYLLHHILVVWSVLHGLRTALHVHQNVGYAQFRHCGVHILIHAASRDIIDNCCSGSYSFPGDSAVHRIDRNDRFGEAGFDGLNRVDHPLQFLLYGDGFRPRARRHPS